MGVSNKRRSGLSGWLPPLVEQALRPYLGRGVYYRGNYPDWQSARLRSIGYDDAAIAQKTLASARKVKAGEARFERDSVLFDEPSYPFAVLATLLRAAAEAGGQLAVLDFGGSLGSSYFQCLPFLAVIKSLQWGIVEQPHLVACGRAELEDGNLRFFDSIAVCEQSIRPNVALLSGVLQYVPDPCAILKELASCGIRYFVIDRTPFSALTVDKITVQYVPKSIYAASYPCRVFSRSTFLAHLPDDCEVLAEFDSDDGSAKVGVTSFTYGGMVLRRRD